MLGGDSLFRISYRETALIADSMAQLIRAGMPSDKVFAILLRHRRSRVARTALEAVRDAVQSGRRFYEGMEDRARAWPKYFIELVRCSERAGLLHSGFEEGAAHFKQMAAVWKTVNMLWIGPSTIIAFGWLIRGFIRLYRYGPPQAFQFWGDCLISILKIVAVVAIIRFIPPVRRAFDAAIMHLPIAGETARDLIIYRFTSCFRYLYMGAVPAWEMVGMAADATGNTHVTKRLKVAAKRVEAGDKFADALAPAEHWPSGYIAGLSAAETSGSLDSMLDKLATERRQALESRVDKVRKTIEPLIMYVVALTIAYEIVFMLQRR
jgi:type II secretory pathway component PulF